MTTTTTPDVDDLCGGDQSANTPPGGSRSFGALARRELRLMLRRPGAASIALLLPFGLYGLTYLGGRPTTPERWGSVLALHVVLALLLTVYLNVLTLVVSRRESLVLKRLRTTELSGRQLLIGMVCPLVGLAVIQLLLMFGIHAFTGLPAPLDPVLAITGAALAVVQAVALALVTATLTASNERVQINCIPVLLGGAVGVQIAAGAFAPALRAGSMVLPLVGPSDLIDKGWAGTQAGVQYIPSGVDPVLAALLVSLAWVVLASLVAARTWRWEPRS